MQKDFTATDPWCPPKTDENQYLQVDLSRKTELTKLATQGYSGDKEKFVKTFALLYSDDGEKWEQYGSKGKEKVLHVLQERLFIILGLIILSLCLKNVYRVTLRMKKMVYPRYHKCGSINYKEKI